MCGLIFSCSPSEVIEETTAQINQKELESSSNSEAQKEQTANNEKFIHKGKQISFADYEKLGEETVSIVGIKDSSDIQYVFGNRKEALVWLEQFGKETKELSLGLTVSGILAEFAEKNNIETKFEATGEIPQEYLDFQTETYLKYYGFDLNQDVSATERTEGTGFIHDGCNYNGDSFPMFGPKPMLFVLDRRVSSYSIVFVVLGFHDKIFFRGKSVYMTPRREYFNHNFCSGLASWNNRARSIFTTTGL